MPFFLFSEFAFEAAAVHLVIVIYTPQVYHLNRHPPVDDMS